MVSDAPADLANAPDYADVPRPDGGGLRRAGPGPAAGPLRGRHRPRRVPGRPLPVRRVGPRGARRTRPGSCPRATSSGTRPGRGCGRTAIRGSSSRTSPTSTSSCCGATRRPVRLGGDSRGRRSGRRRRRRRPSSRSRRRSASWRWAGSGRGGLADDLAERHLVDPALAPVRAQDEPVDAALLEQLDLVALVEEADLVAAQLVGRVEQPDDVVADEPALATVERADQAVVEGQARRGGRRRGSGRPCGPRAATAGASAACQLADRAGARRRRRRRAASDPRSRRRWRPRHRWPPRPRGPRRCRAAHRRGDACRRRRRPSRRRRRRRSSRGWRRVRAAGRAARPRARPSRK